MKHLLTAFLLSVTSFLFSGEFTHPIQCVSHRGEEFDAPEGSRAAYQLAVQRKAEVMKLDICFTKDGIPVMSHDPSLKRMMNWNVKIADVTLAEIRRKGVFKKVGKYAGEKMLTLAEALPIVKATPEFWVDFKVFPDGALEKVIPEFQKAGIALNRLMIVNFKHKVLLAAKAKYPQIRRVEHIRITKMPDGTFSTSFPPKKFATKEAAFQALLAEKQKLGLYGMNMPFSAFREKILTKDDLQRLRKAGLWCSLWFVHNAKDAGFACKLGSDAFVTGRIGAVRSFCRTAN